MIEFFPLDEPRSGQKSVLDAIEKAFEVDGYKNVLLEAPVGSGKSAIAITVARWMQSKIAPGRLATHALTPRKSLQDQYWEDFHHLNLCMMKGRTAYPCTFDKPIAFYNSAIKEIGSGGQFKFKGTSCAEGPCVNKSAIKRICTKSGAKPCPYQEAIHTAQSKSIIVHNLHSFIFQAYFSENFETREIMIVDECHELEGIIREFAIRKVQIPLEANPDIEFRKLTQWITWFRQFTDNFSPVISGVTGISPREKFEELLQDLTTLASYGFEDEFVVESSEERGKTTFEFTANNISRLVDQFLLSFGNKRLLMSGTIYDKDLFCKTNGLKPEETCFIRIGSTMPISTRPIYLKKKYMVDTSHKNWNTNFKEMITKVQSVMDVFDDVKGLIHTPSYKASMELYLALKHTGRIMIHEAKNFTETLEEFYARDGNKILLSPICQQGVDFKHNRARFQIILRVPYANVSNKFVEYKMKNDFSWYNHQALVVFGQQIGRINRSDDDFGATILMDSRFHSFLAKNEKKLPKWLKDAVVRD